MVKNIIITEEQASRLFMVNESKENKYLNMNVTLRKGGRNAVRMTIPQFKEEFSQAFMTYAMENEISVINRGSNPHRISNVCYTMAYKNSRNEKSNITKELYKDIWGGKYKFDSENVEMVGDVKVTKNGRNSKQKLTFL